MDIETISEKYQLNSEEYKVLEYMDEHRLELKDMGIRDLAKATFVSPSFIVKTCKKMKLSGYSELVFLIADSPWVPTNSENDLKVRSYAKQFSQLLNKHRDSMIMILGSGYSQNLANYMSEYFNVHG